MKLLFRIVFLLVIVFMNTNVCFGQDKGMKFFEGSWDELMATAKKTGKPVFIDVYTTWCGPCKLMAKNIFPLEAVGNKYNNAFINYKLDAEAGEGVSIAKKYKVNAYPTYLYIKNDGELAYKGMGYHPDPENFINEADKALQALKDPYTVSKMEEDFKNGKRDTAFLKAYISKLSQLEMDNTEPLDAYLILQPGAIDFIGQQVNSTTGKTFPHLMKNAHILFSGDTADRSREFELKHKLANLLQRDVSKAMESGNLEQAKRGIDYAVKLPGLDPYFTDYFTEQKLTYLEKTNKIPELIAATHKYLKDISSLTVEQVKAENERHYNAFMEPYLSGRADSTKDESFGKMREYVQQQHIVFTAAKYFSAARHFYNTVNKKEDLRKALDWSKKAHQLLPQSASYKKLVDDLEKKLGVRRQGKPKM